MALRAKDDIKRFLIERTERGRRAADDEAHGSPIYSRPRGTVTASPTRLIPRARTRAGSLSPFLPQAGAGGPDLRLVADSTEFAHPPRFRVSLERKLAPSPLRVRSLRPRTEDGRQLNRTVRALEVAHSPLWSPL